MQHSARQRANSLSPSSDPIFQAMYIPRYSEKVPHFPIFLQPLSWWTVVRTCMWPDGEVALKGKAEVLIRRFIIIPQLRDSPLPRMLSKAQQTGMIFTFL